MGVEVNVEYIQRIKLLIIRTFYWYLFIHVFIFLALCEYLVLRIVTGCFKHCITVPDK